MQSLVCKSVSTASIGNIFMASCSYKAAGDSQLLKSLGETNGIQVNIVDLVEAEAGGMKGQISSSRIRTALNQGRMQQVAQSLGRAYRLMANIGPETMSRNPDHSSLRFV